MKETGFARHYRSQAFRTYRFREGSARRPFVRVARSIPGFLYIAIGPLAVWRDGHRIGIGRR